MTFIRFLFNLMGGIVFILGLAELSYDEINHVKVFMYMCISALFFVIGSKGNKYG